MIGRALWRQRFDDWVRTRQRDGLPVRFDRRCIYVLPTPFGWFYLLLLLAMGVGALNYNNNPALLLGLLLAGAAQTSLLAAHLQLSGLEVTALVADPVPAGASLQLRLHARAEPGRARRGLRVACGQSHGWLALEHGAGVAELALPTTQRGWLDMERVTLSTTRPLGLGTAWGYVWPDAPLLVYPAPEIDGPPLPEGSGASSQARLQMAGDDIHHLRRYRQGDARSAIAWKPSARRDTLLVREFEQPRGADLRLEWAQVASLPREAAIQRLARWVDEAERDGRRYVLSLPMQPAIGPDKGTLHRHACLKALALLPASGPV